MKPISDKKKISEVFDRGVIAQILPSREELMQFLGKGGKLKIYIGVDPTATSLHLGHAGNILFLEDLRKLGHEVILLIGDFTARIGDPSDRSAARQPLTTPQIKTNMRQWIAQVQPILGLKDKKNPARIMYNSTWLGKLKFADILTLASEFTVQQMIERDMFQKRLAAGSPIHLHEFLYPLMQGYDSVAMDVNAELCGTDQLFNAMAGRTLLKRLKGKDKFVITLTLLQNPKTGEMMSKSKGTGIFLSSPPEEMYGAVMAQPDEMTEVLLVHATRVPLSEKKEIFSRGPKAAKQRVAFEIVKLIYGEKKAQAAEDHFEKTFSRHEISEDAPVLKLSAKPISALDLVVASGVLASKSEARRLIEQGGFEVAGETVKNPLQSLILKGGEPVRIGKKRFFRVRI